MTCWRRGCNKPDRFLRLLLPFQVCTCKNHNEKVEGLLVKALATKRLQVGCERKRVPDKVCGICGNLLSGGEDSVACSQPSCSFAFCRSCVESLFLHDNMHGPIYDKRDSFNQIKKHEAKWKCWVCQTIERTEKTKGYREVYLEELIARLPEDVQKRILSLQYVAQTQATHSDLLPPPPPPQPKQQEETQPESPPTQPIAPIPSQQQQQQQPTSTSPPRQQQHHQQSPKQPQEQRKEQTLPQEPEKRSRRHYATRRETHEEAANEDSGFGIGSFRRLSSRQVKLKLRSEVTSGNGGSGGNNGSGGNGGSNGSSGNNGGGGSSGNNNGNGEGRRRDEDEELTPMRRLCEGLVEIACFWSETAKKEEEKVMITHIFDTARDIYTRPNNGIDEEWMREEVEDAAEELQKSEAYLKMLVDRPKHSKSSETTVGRLRSLSRALAGHVHSVGVAAEGCAAFMKEMSAVSREQTKDAKAELRAAKTEYRVYCPKGDKSGESNSENSGEEEEEEDDDDDDEEEDEEREGTGKGTAAGGGKRKRGRHTKAIKNPLELQLEVLNKQLRKNRAEVAKREAEKKELERRLEKGPRVYAEDTEEAKKELEAMKSNAYAVGESKEQFRCLENFLRDYLELQRKYTEDLTRQCENKKRYAKIQERMEMGMPMGAPRLVAIYHPECLGHRVPADHLYQPCYLERAIEVVKRLGTQGLIDVQDSPNEAHHFFIGLVHKIKYVRTLVSAAPRDPSDPPVPLYQDVTGPAAPYLSPFSLKAATLSAGTVFEAVNQIATGNAQIAFCVTLPGSNRVGRDRTQGPGLLNDAAIGVEYAQKLIPITHSAIVDLDATQGCGTLEIFAGSKKVAAISVQAYTNSWDQETTATLAAVAAGDTGNTRNVWLPRGCSGEEWLHAIAKNVAEPLRMFEPYLLVFNMGFNGLRTDPEHLMNLTPEDYAAATRIVTEACPKARIISILGGCSAPLEDFTAAVEQHIHALTQRLVMPSHPLLQEPAHADMAATGGITAVTTTVKPETEEASKEPTKIVTTDVSIKTEPATNDGTKS